MKQFKLSLLSAAIVAMSANAADYSNQTIIVEGSSMRPGAFGVAPESLALKDTAALLKRIPGANVNRNGPLTGIASYRGQFGSRINAVVDGMSWKEVGPNSMDPPLSHIPAALTDTLTVYRGIAPVSSGIETIGGSMSAESRKSKFTSGKDFEFHGLASLGYSEADNGLTSAVLGTYANDSHRFHASVSQEKGNDYEFDGSKSVDPSQYDRDAYTVGYGTKFGAHELGFNYSNNDTGHTGSASLPMDIIWVRGGIFSADYSVQLGDDRSFEASYYYQDMRHLMNNFTLRSNGVGGNKERQNVTLVDGGGLSLVYNMPLAGGRLSLGLEGDKSKHDGFITSPTVAAFGVDNFNGAEKNRYSTFAEWKGDVAEGLELETGVRYTQVDMDSDSVNHHMATAGANPFRVLRDAFNNSDLSQTDHNWDFDVILRQTISNELTAEVGFARKTRSASYQERYLWTPLEATGGLADNRVYIGDVNLDSETAYQFELGLEYAAGGLYVAPRAFYHRVNDYIQGEEITGTVANTVRGMATGGASTTVLQFTNVDAELYGMDVEWGYDLVGDFRLDGTVSYVRGRRIDGGGDNLYRIAPLNTRAQLTYEQNTWSVATEVEAYSAQNDVASYNSELKTGGYALLHIRGDMQPVAGVNIGVGVENILDKNYADHTSAINRAAGNSDVAVGDRIPGQGRNVYITASYEW
ncbi:MAG: TonB-dependent receptor [Cycloclasticus sp. symbiont of Bathymodiolus heckerae]|nr:MAG: TonB-dependent receptor [Cycloclasticus sp. symbiont of Bathymodiolus heckerae]